MKESEVPVIEVWLSEPIGRVKGRPWPLHSDGRPLEITAVEEPCQVVVYLGSGRALRTRAKTVTIEQENGVVTQVSPLPLPDVVEFPEAVAEVDRLAEAWGVARDPQLRERLDEWRAERPEPDIFGKTYLTGAKLETGALVYFGIRPHTSGRGWYVVVDITRPALGETE